MLRVKVCGITRPEDARAAVALGADAIGMIFYPGSPRAIHPREAGAILAEVPAEVARIGVTVSPSRALIRLLMNELDLSAIQVHGDHRAIHEGDLPPDRFIPAFQVGPGFDPAILKVYERCPLCLLDARKAGQYGGTGTPFDWSLADGLSREHRIVLAGGLGPANLVAAVTTVRPFAIDLNSGVERAPGIKDTDLLTNAFETIKEFRHEHDSRHPSRFLPTA